MKRLKSEKGVALIIVLWVMVILSFILISLSEEIQLENYLTRNIMDKTHLKFTAQAGISRGIAALHNDETLVDGNDEVWAEPIKAQIENKGNFEVKIEDIGSRFNINHIGEPVLTALLSGNSKSFASWRIDNYPFILMKELKDFEEVELADMEEMITFYGKFNLMTGDKEILKEIMIENDITRWSADQMIKKIEELKEKKRSIRSFDELVKKVPGLDATTLERLEDDITLTGSINLNLADKETLRTLISSLDLSTDIVTAIVKAREDNVIKDVSQLKKTITEENFKRIASYVDISSKYFRLTCTAKSSSTSLEKQIIVELKRTPEKISQGKVLEWRTEILSWLES